MTDGNALMDRLDPDYRREAAALPADDADWIADPPERLREVYRASRALLAGDAAPDVRVEPFRYANGVEGLRFRPAALRNARRAIVWFHGGGWVVGAPETHIVPASHLAAMTGLEVLSVRYRLAPEHRFPAQREDGVLAVSTILSATQDDRAAPEEVFLAGDSAGAAMAFWADAALDGPLRRRIAGIVGFYGGYGLRDSPSIRAFEAAGDGMSAAALAAYRARLGDPDSVPGFVIVETAPAEGAPCYLAAAGLDPLLDDSRALHARFRSGDRASVLRIAETLPHAYLHFAGRVPAAAAQLRAAADWIRGLDR